MAKHLNTFAEKNNLLSNLQFGFCKVFGVHDTLLTIANSAQKALDSAYKVHIVGLDLSAAFECVYLKALTFKLRQLSAGVPFLIFLTEFLTNRLKRVIADGLSNEYRCYFGCTKEKCIRPFTFHAV